MRILHPDGACWFDDSIECENCIICGLDDYDESTEREATDQEIAQAESEWYNWRTREPL